MDGILNIHKHTGPSSFSIVSQVKRLTGAKKAGHAGTLDPAASGVLPICLGRATRIAEYLQEYPKTYRAEIEFGITTDTYDREGTVTGTADASDVTLTMIESILSGFHGEISQTPPAYSALKQNGVPLYKLARSGQEITLKSRPVSVYDIDIIDWHSPVLTLDITCSKGTYIRSLAHDIGQELSVGAYMKNLIRIQYGPFTIEDAITIPQFETVIRDGICETKLFPIDSVLKHLPAFVISDETETDVKNGRPVQKSSVIPIPDLPSVEITENRYRLYLNNGGFLGIFRYFPEEDSFRPEKIFI